ncbi:MAG: ABC transporter permease [Paracoccaceae bacterium]
MTSKVRGLGLTLLIIWLLAPLIPLAIWSFSAAWFFPDLLPAEWSLQGWRYAMSDASGVIDSLWLTLGIAALTSGLSALIGVPAGRALGMHQFRGKQLVELIVLAPLIVPGIAVAMGLHSVFIGLGLNNTVAGVVLVHLVPTLPYMVLMMAAVFANFDVGFEDQARSLGASPLRVFWHITLPAILPGLVVGALFAFLVSWSQYLLTLLVGGGRIVTMPLLLFNFVAAGRNDLAGAIGMIYILPGVIVLALTARHLAGNTALIRMGKP